MLSKVFFTLLAVLLCVSCASPDVSESAPDAKDAAGMLDSGSQKLGDGLLRAFKADDAEKFCSYLTPDTRKSFGEKEFAASHKAIAESLGEIKSYTFLTKLDSPLFNSYIWKVKFTRRNADGKDFSHETLFRIVTAPLDGKANLISFGFL